ncbi:MAG TPA: hypothetical protein DDY32_02215 [Desulfobulbaceae bacterium]|nr:hypothetical protein [Desulfobulbaceae bacterium]
MNWANILAFLVFPYIALTIFVFGHGSRYLTDRYGWNAKSSEFLEKRSDCREKEDAVNFPPGFS